MKKIIYIILVFLVNSNIFAQTGWTVHSTETNKPIRDIYFVDANTGWAVGDSVIVKSTNGGVNWTQQNFYYPGGALLLSVKFLNQNTGYAGGGNITPDFYHYYQYLFKTTNSGANWNLVWESQNIYNGSINSIIIINENLIYISLFGYIETASQGGIFKSTNGGLNFSSCIGNIGVNSVYFLNSLTGWIATLTTTDISNSKRSRIFKTTNGGINWQRQFQDSGNYCGSVNSVQFVNENTGYALEGKSQNKTLFLKTTNSGLNWDSVRYNHSKYYSMFFLNQNTGWISGSWVNDSSPVSYTSNGGANWSNQLKNNFFTLDKVYFVDDLNGWAVNYYSDNHIFRTTTGGIVIVNNISTEIPEKYSLSQNYPNPFNPSTNLKYQIKDSRFVTLKVFDITGKEITTLVNEKQSPGTYEVKFEAEYLPSGVYFYKIAVGDYSEAKKMILIN
ncbi:MAG: T9SS type A sorting domain-containing protein [Ignavibacteriae bacterium]|nr:T9SS type A sorting domain-containing protein [Ignavibacteriota bacterium]